MIIVNVMGENKEKIEIELKTEPAGEICAGSLNDDAVSEFREVFIKDSLKVSEFVQGAYSIDDLGHTYGVFTGKTGGDVRNMKFDKDNYNVHSTIEIPNKNGIYIVYSGLSKISNYFRFSPYDGEVFNSLKMTFNVTDVNLGMVTDHAYGELVHSVIDGYLYNGIEINGSMDGHVDRGIDRDVSIIFVNNNEKHVIYHVSNESEETYYPEQLKKFAAYLKKTGDKEWVKKIYEKAEV